MKMIARLIYYLVLIGLNAGAAYYMAWLYLLNKGVAYCFSFLRSMDLPAEVEENDLLVSMKEHALVLIGIISLVSLLWTLGFKRRLGFGRRQVIRVSIIQVLSLVVCCGLILTWIYNT